MSEHTKKEWEIAEEIYQHWASGYECFAVDSLANYTATLKAQRNELLAERDKLLFHESQLVESLKSYMNKYGPGYSCTDTLAYDNATGVLAAIANAEKDKSGC